MRLSPKPGCSCAGSLVVPMHYRIRASHELFPKLGVNLALTITKETKATDSRKNTNKPIPTAIPTKHPALTSTQASTQASTHMSTRIHTNKVLLTDHHQATSAGEVEACCQVFLGHNDAKQKLRTNQVLVVFLVLFLS